jgi:hypothetical protein
MPRETVLATNSMMLSARFGIHSSGCAPNGAACALDLEVVVDHQHEHADRDTQRAVQVGRRDHAHMRERLGQAEPADHARGQINRDEVERIHERDPHENRECERCDEAAIAVDHRLGLVFDHLDQHLDCALETSRHAGRGFTRCQTENDDRDDTAKNRPEQRVEIPDVDIENRRLRRSGEILQMVRDVLRRIHRVRSFASCHNFKATQIVENLPPPV